MEKTLPRTRSCFVCGVANPLGLNLGFVLDGPGVRARFRPRPEHAGFKGVVHGGLVATVLDEAMVWAIGVRTGCFAYSAELSVRYRRPVPPEAELVVRGELTDQPRRRLLLARAELCDAAGVVLAEATGKYMPLPPEAQGELLADFVGDLDALPLPGRSGPGGPSPTAPGRLSESPG